MFRIFVAFCSIMAGGLVASEGRIMARKPGYKLNPHSDSAQYAVTCLLYFTNADDVGSGALCLYRPEQRPELRHTSTYYPVKEEGLTVELVKEIPIRENLFVAFLNDAESLHGARVNPGSDGANAGWRPESGRLPRSTSSGWRFAPWCEGSAATSVGRPGWR